MHLAGLTGNLHGVNKRDTSCLFSKSRFGWFQSSGSTSDFLGVHSLVFTEWLPQIQASRLHSSTSKDRKWYNQGSKNELSSIVSLSALHLFFWLVGWLVGF